MQAIIVFKGGTQTIVDVEKVHVTQHPDGRIIKLDWTTPADAHSILKAVDPSQVAAVVMLRPYEEP